MTVYTKIIKNSRALLRKPLPNYITYIKIITLPEGHQNTNMNTNLIEWWKFQGNIWESFPQILSTYIFSYLKCLVQCLLLMVGNQYIFIPVNYSPFASPSTSSLCPLFPDFDMEG